MVLLRHLLGDALRRLRLRQGRTLREVSASAEAGPAAAKVRIGAAGGRQLAVRERPAMGGPVPGRTIVGPAPGRLPARAGQRLGAPQAPAIDAVSMQGGSARPGAAFDQLTWRAPDITDMVPV